MAEDRDKKIKDILEDLYALDGGLRDYEEELKKLIEKLLTAKPDVEFDDGFKEKLRMDLLSRIAEMKRQKEAKKEVKGFGFSTLLFGLKPAYALSFLILCILVLIPVIFFSQRGGPTEAPPSETREGTFELANPAAVYCEEQGGTLESRILGGGARGFCIFEDGSECEQWDFFRKECRPGERFCKDLCGDGTCQEVVCLAVGCPCSETPESCPQDCK